jgi:hypothetical protein
LAYLNEEQVFDNKQTRDFFGPGGIGVPQVRDYLHSIMNYYWIAKHSHFPLKPSAGEHVEGDSQQEVRQCSLQASETH